MQNQKLLKMGNQHCSANLICKLFNQEMNYVLASGRDRSGNPFCPLSQSSMGKKIGVDSPVPLRLAWQPALLRQGYGGRAFNHQVV
jgi:hypothetical protein